MPRGDDARFPAFDFERPSSRNAQPVELLARLRLVILPALARAMRVAPSVRFAPPAPRVDPALAGQAVPKGCRKHCLH
jgi:hypothetical protein